MSKTTETLELISYRGNCHCGAFKFIFKAPELKEAESCNCSICSKKGSLWVFPSSSGLVSVVQGNEDTTLKNYEFGLKTHKFCSTCGTPVMARVHDAAEGKAIAINIRALADVDFDSLKVLTTDGAALEPLYQAPEALDVGPVPARSVLYHGNCHCGAITYALLNPEKISRIVECNCSICWRDAALWIHPTKTTVTFKGLESMAEYTFGRKTTYHGFCKICGVAIRERFTAPNREHEAALNVRAMNGINLAAMAVKKNNGKAGLPYQI
ncbi:glutathione-dependent formaldehyde-activating enzyme [Mycena olivaceomarginata]|nr:glutathione-dependent formaldehyde-activating enzyme [Mycena olivaceomarginata]